MSKKTELFASNHTAQITWLDGQIAKNNLGVFLNPKLAEEAWSELKDKNMGIIDDQDVEAFMSRYLSDVGDKKLYTTLRVAETRAKKSDFRLQCCIDYSANRTLQVLAAKTGLSKGEIVSQLVDNFGQDWLKCNNSEESETVLDGINKDIASAGGGKKLSQEIQDDLDFEMEARGEAWDNPVPHEEQLDLNMGGEWVVYTKFSQVKPGVIMRSIESGIEHVVCERAARVILFEDGGELDAYQAKNRYEIKK